MSLIACTSNCLYERDGYCSLARVASCGMPCAEDPCIHFIPRRISHIPLKIPAPSCDSGAEN